MKSLHNFSYKSVFHLTGSPIWRILGLLDDTDLVVMIDKVVLDKENEDTQVTNRDLRCAKRYELCLSLHYNDNT